MDFVKRLLTILTVLILPTLAVAQDANIKQSVFTLTYKGFVNSSDTTKAFIVIDLPGKSQPDLYKKSLIYLSGLYVSPKEVLSTVDNESITVNAVAKNAIKMKVLWLNPSWDINYTISIQFKEGKLRIMQPNINSMRTYTGDLLRTASITPGDGPNHKDIYDKKGNLKQKDGKENIERFINEYVNEYIKALKSDKQDSW